MTKLILSDFDEPVAFWMVGLVSNSPDYKLVFHLNKHFELSLARTAEDFVKQNKAGTDHLFAFFEQPDHDNKINWYLIQNRAFGRLHLQPDQQKTVLYQLPDPAFVVPSFSKYDYFLVLCAIPSQKLQTQIIKGLRGLHGVQYAQVCVPQKKELKHLNFEPYYDH